MGVIPLSPLDLTFAGGLVMALAALSLRLHLGVAGQIVVAALRMMALAILAVARRLSSMKHCKETPSWGQVAEHFLLLLCCPTLLTAAFDDV